MTHSRKQQGRLLVYYKAHCFTFSLLQQSDEFAQPGDTIDAVAISVLCVISYVICWCIICYM
jgi:predicted amidohydrolase